MYVKVYGYGGLELSLKFPARTDHKSVKRGLRNNGDLFVRKKLAEVTKILFKLRHFAKH